MNYLVFPSLLGALLLPVVCSAAAEASPLRPLPINEAEAANHRWLNKPVLAARLLDGMEETNHWSHLGRGQMACTGERACEGQRSLRLVCPTKEENPNRGGRPWGECTARRVFDGEDWTAYNRLSFWVYPHLPGFKVISMLVRLRNEGLVKVPDAYGREGLNYFLLKPDQWNHVVWEIPHLARDKVTGVDLVYRQQGHEPGATNIVCYDLDRLELQRVEADYYEGWPVAPGRLAYSHSGYPADGPKTALASGPRGTRFKLIEEATGKTVLAKAAQQAKGPVGEFLVLDFSAFKRPGLYHLEAGGLRTPSFPIGEGIWRESVVKTINFFYCERCGAAIPGIHDVCHADWRAAHGGTNLFINGGWHDAGDLSQGLINTAEATYAMWHLAETLQARDPALAGRLLEEARWGLDWLLKTRFGDGARVTWATMDYWTDGLLGTSDDMTVQGNDSPYENFTAAATEALGARLLKAPSPALAARSLQAAQADWGFAVAKLGAPSLELASAGALASLELFKSTCEQQYADRASELASVIVDCQQQELTPWRLPLAGFFYTSPRRTRLLHYFHRGHEQAPIVALADLCRALPQHPDWMKWYATVALHSEYLSRLARPTEPYGLLCASVYSLDESNDPRFLDQVRQGVPLSDKHYLRRFPVWFDFRGNSGTVLSQTKALSAAALLRRQPRLFELAQHQLQWHVGRNPFGQSLLYGEGHDYAPQYTAMSGDMVGSLPVGVQTRAQADVPYWPAANCYNYKEVWVHPSSRWLWIMSDVMAAQPQSSEAPRLAVSQAGTDGQIRFRLTVPAAGAPAWSIRGSNLRFDDARPAVSGSRRTQTLTWAARPVSTRGPWVAVLVPGGDLSRIVDAVGGWPGPDGRSPWGSF